MFVIRDKVGGFQVRVTSDILDVVEITFRSCTLSGAMFKKEWNFWVFIII